MDYTIEVRDFYIYVKISGHMSFTGLSDWEKIESARLDVVDSIKKNKIYKLLIDGSDLSAKVSMIGRFLIAKFFVEENLKLIAGRLPSLKITLVGNRSLIDPGKFGETVARNRGLYVLVTDDMQEALRWLGEDAPPQGEL